MGRKIFIDNFYTNIKYDKNKIYCEILNNIVNIVFKNYSPFVYTSNIIQDDENENMLINASYNYDGIKKYSKSYINSSIHTDQIQSNKKIYLYYTDFNNVFSNILFIIKI